MRSPVDLSPFNDSRGRPSTSSWWDSRGRPAMHHTNTYHGPTQVATRQASSFYGNYSTRPHNRFPNKRNPPSHAAAAATIGIFGFSSYLIILSCSLMSSSSLSPSGSPSSHRSSLLLFSSFDSSCSSEKLASST